MTQEGGHRLIFSTDRDAANADDGLELLGLDHPVVSRLLERHRALPPDEIGLAVRSADRRSGVLAIWSIEWTGAHGQNRRAILRLGIDEQGRRVPAWEHHPEDLFYAKPVSSPSDHEMLSLAEATMDRELRHRGLVSEHQPYSGLLIGWVRVVAFP